MISFFGAVPATFGSLAALFEAIQGLVPWQIPVTWVSAVIGIVLVDLVYYLEHRFGSEEHYLDANYSGILMVWDRLFGTFKPETNRAVYGLTTQIESFNPIDVQFSEVRKLWQDGHNDRRWGTKLQRLWREPCWQPATPVSNALVTAEARS
jgi:sterol desaturase/sphingolipid hydroxylase (fatty acid hydroxylase superfamily)